MPRRPTLAPAEAPTRLVLTVPMPPNIANGAHGSWRGKHGRKLAYWKLLDQHQGANLIPAPPSVPFAKARLSSVMYLWNPMDDDNAMRRHKYLADWLKTRGYIVDDRKKCLTWAGFPEQVITRKEEPRIVLTLEAA